MNIPAYEEWATAAAPYFQNSGVHPAFSRDVARLYVYAWGRGLEPRFTSIWRDPARQNFLREMYDQGRAAEYGLRVRPAANSKHSTVLGGVPAALAVDMPSRDDRATAKLASDLGIGSGMAFSVPDPGHYYSLKA